MRIASIAAGAGGMYCGSCMRDNRLARALIDLGHPTVLVPTYTPLKTDEQDVSLRRVFYGGVGVFLAQRFPFLRRRIPILDRILDSRALLGVVGRLGISTEASRLGDLTVSILRGEDGNQRKSLAELIDFLRDEVRPEIVHLTNSLFAGIAPVLRARLGVPVVCTLQGEDLFLEGLPAVHREEAKGLIRRAAESIDAFVAVSAFARDFMAAYLGIDRARIRVIPPGISLDGVAPKQGAGAARDPARAFTIGYLARIAPEKGLAVLADAFRVLRESLARDGWSGPPPRLRAAGYLGRAERPYLAAVEKRLAAAGLAGSFEYAGELDRAEKFRFLREVDVLSVPAPYPESMGAYAYEALAVGTPLVLPRLGAFPEIVEGTGGGILVEKGDPQALAEGLRRLLLDPALGERLGRAGEKALRERFDDAAMARETAALYEEILAERGSGARR